MLILYYFQLILGRIYYNLFYPFWQLDSNPDSSSMRIRVRNTASWYYLNNEAVEKLIFSVFKIPIKFCMIIGRTCEAAIAGLESVDDITDKYNIEFVKVNNKKYARGLGIR